MRTAVLLSALLSGGLASAQLLDQAAAEAMAQKALAGMSQADKIGQTSMAHMFRFTANGRSGPLGPSAENTFSKLRPGSTLNGGGDTPQPNTPQGWAEFLRQLDTVGRETLSGVPTIFGTDAVHGVNNVPQATLFPHNLGLGATFNPVLTQEVAQATAADMRAMNMRWSFSPVADVGRDPRWGRYYETFGEAPWLVADQVAASVRGLQAGGVAATLKHYAGYSQPMLGQDRWNAEIGERALHEIFLPPFKAGIEAGALAVMANSGSVNGKPVHASKYLLTDVLRGELGFRGLLVSDWNDMDRLVFQHKTHAGLVGAVADSINAGVDIYMVPNTVETYQTALGDALKDGLIRPERLDEAALHMLTFKARLGLFDAFKPGSGTLNDHAALAQRAAAASLTLLENDGTLPITKGKVLVTGPAMDSAAIQLGGWSVNWQGVGKGNVPNIPQVSLLAASLKATAPGHVKVSALPDGKREALLKAARQTDTIVLALGEAPAAEWLANNLDLTLPEAQLALLRDVVNTGKPVVLVLMAGRPIILPTDLQQRLKAVVMAYLPGAEGGAALADAIYGRAGFPGRLPFTWPDAMTQAGLTADALPSGDVQPDDDPLPLYTLGYGLDYTSFTPRDLQVVKGSSGVSVRVNVMNTGERPSTATYVVWVSLPPAGNLEPLRRPVAVVQAVLKAGEKRSLSVNIPLERLQAFIGDAFGPLRGELVPGSYGFAVGDEREALTLP